MLDSRGHGQSTRTSAPIGYDLMASDVLALMDYLYIQRAALVGWSDGAYRPRHRDPSSRAPHQAVRLCRQLGPIGCEGREQEPGFTAYIKRAEQEYRALSPTPGQFKAFFDNISHMWATEPHFSDEQLRGIKVPTWIVDADHDEAIKPRTPTTWRR